MICLGPLQGDVTCLGPKNWHKSRTTRIQRHFYHLTGCINKKNLPVRQNHFCHEGTAELLSGFSLKMWSFHHRVTEVGMKFWNELLEIIWSNPTAPIGPPLEICLLLCPKCFCITLKWGDSLTPLDNLPVEMRQCKKHFLMFQGNFLFQLHPLAQSHHSTLLSRAWLSLCPPFRYIDKITL